MLTFATPAEAAWAVATIVFLVLLGPALAILIWSLTDRIARYRARRARIAAAFDDLTDELRALRDVAATIDPPPTDLTDNALAAVAVELDNPRVGARTVWRDEPEPPVDYDNPAAVLQAAGLEAFIAEQASRPGPPADPDRLLTIADMTVVDLWLAYSWRGNGGTPVRLPSGAVWVPAEGLVFADMAAALTWQLTRHDDGLGPVAA